MVIVYIKQNYLLGVFINIINFIARHTNLIRHFRIHYENCDLRKIKKI